MSKTLTNSQYKVIFQVEIQNYKVWFYYQYERDGNTSVAELTPIQSQMQNLKPDEWHLITVTVISKYLSYFIDGKLITAALLKGAVKDPGGRVRIGQRYGGKNECNIIFVVQLLQPNSHKIFHKFSMFTFHC